MRRFGVPSLGIVFFVVCVSGALIWAQAATQPSPPAQSQSSAQSSPPVSNPNAAAGRDLANASEQAVHAAEGGTHEENAQFKYSQMVARVGSIVGLDAHQTYWLSLSINFLILVLFFWFLLKARIPQIFRDRSSNIQKALKEAQAASAEAARRLGDIETRLSRLDADVADIRAGAEREAAAEDERLRAAAEEDKRKMMEAAESEIAAITRNARLDLKSFAASLAVDIAAHKIKVDDTTDRALVRQFVGSLGKDGE